MMVVPTWVHMAVLLAVWALAWAKGGAAERFAATCLLTPPVYYAMTRELAGPFGSASHVVRDMISDTILTLLFVGLVLRSTRYWTVALSATTVLAVMLEAVQLIRPVSGWTYGTAGFFFWYLSLSSIVWGVWQTWQARRRDGG